MSFWSIKLTDAGSHNEGNSKEHQPDQGSLGVDCVKPPVLVHQMQVEVANWYESGKQAPWPWNEIIKNNFIIIFTSFLDDKMAEFTNDNLFISIVHCDKII